MDVTRLLRVLITLIFVMTFILIIVSVYRYDQELRSVSSLADSTTSIVTRLSIQDLAWVDSLGDVHHYEVDPDKLDDLTYQSNLGGVNVEFNVELSYKDSGVEQTLGPYGPTVPEGRMASALNVPVAVQSSGRTIPAILKVRAWYA